VSYEIKVLDLMDVDVESSFLVLAHDMGVVRRAKTWAYLLLGGSDAILVDTGASSTGIMGRLGMVGHTSEDQRLESQLARHGVAPGDVRWILHTHAHIDHAGQDDRFPAATVVMTRRELEFSASGLMGARSTRPSTSSTTSTVSTRRGRCACSTWISRVRTRSCPVSSASSRVATPKAR
jgi:ribonuclease BN (tRNA processing enzyme)